MYGSVTLAAFISVLAAILHFGVFTKTLKVSRLAFIGFGISALELTRIRQKTLYMSHCKVPRSVAWTIITFSL